MCEAMNLSLYKGFAEICLLCVLFPPSPPFTPFPQKSRHCHILFLKAYFSTVSFYIIGQKNYTLSNSVIIFIRWNTIQFSSVFNTGGENHVFGCTPLHFLFSHLTHWCSSFTPTVHHNMSQISSLL